MSLLQEMQTHGLADCAFNRQLWLKDKYNAYCYWCAKQGITALSLAAWKSTVRKGALL